MFSATSGKLEVSSGSPQYCALFSLGPPMDFRITACGLNCGCYFMPYAKALPPKKMGPIFEAYFPEAYLP